MVDGSELAFRLLTRRYGVQLAYTPMLHAKMMTTHEGYAGEHFTTCAADRPLVAQFAGHDPATVLAAARMVQGRVDAVDLNLGCPQGIARRGRYGAFLLEDTATSVAVVEALAGGLPVPVTVKVRVLPTWDATLRTVLALQAAGAAAMTVHGRTRTNMKQSITAVDWAIIAALRAHPDVRLPIFANGGIACADDVAPCLAATGAQAVMSSEAILENPALFADTRAPGTGARVDVLTLAREYATLAEETGTHPGVARGHLIKILFRPLAEFTTLRGALLGAGGSDRNTYASLRAIIDAVEAAVTAAGSRTPAALAGTDVAARGAAAWREWATTRADQPAAGLVPPYYITDVLEPGAWYMRHRKGVYGGLPGAARPPPAAAAGGGGSGGGGASGEGEDDAAEAAPAAKRRAGECADES